jgi:hypothetical protein
MSKKPAKNSLASIDPSQLGNVQGGASRVTSRSGGSSDQITQALTAITSQIKDLAGNKGGMDPMMMMMMMMMMGGGGGGGGGAPVAAAPAPQPQMPIINITTDVRRRW